MYLVNLCLGVVFYVGLLVERDNHKNLNQFPQVLSLFLRIYFKRVQLEFLAKTLTIHEKF